MDEKPNSPRRVPLIEIAVVGLIGLFAIGTAVWTVYALLAGLSSFKLDF